MTIFHGIANLTVFETTEHFVETLISIAKIQTYLVFKTSIEIVLLKYFRLFK